MDGREATLGQFPWQASLTINFNSYHFFCGGSLIHMRWVLTAAHCLEENMTLARNISILLGTIDRANASGAVLRHSSEYYIHDDYRRFDSDIALVKLNEIVVDTENVRAIMLGNYLYPGLNVVVSGFGITQEGSMNTKLHYVELITIRNVDCITSNGSSVRTGEVCATPVNGSTYDYHKKKCLKVNVVSFIINNNNNCLLLLSGAKEKDKNIYLLHSNYNCPTSVEIGHGKSEIVLGKWLCEMRRCINTGYITGYTKVIDVKIKLRKCAYRRRLETQVVQ
ncbi:hypothetical protein RI129_004574 [Pyrocoelia pectoralis]|uniref:Peptidase S1 domain-containing protein n=1 Tax=Pyrocoelia pectoralis TaxID=417401 RepID=A0AAN7VD47_9COLE